MKMRIGIGGRFAMTAVLAALAASALADQLILKNGQVMEAKTIRYKASTQEYIVTTDESTVPVPAKSVQRAVVPKPPAVDQATAALAAGKFDEAAKLLESVVNDYTGLEWDNVGRDLLGQALMGKKDFRKAVSIYKEIIENVPPERVSLSTRRHYWDALKGAEMFAVLKSDLEKVIAGGTRDIAALAQLMRGDMYAAQGQKNEALLDYLRTVVLYEKVTELQPEALFKAATLLEELRDPRAADLKKKLAQEFGSSPYAKRAAGG